MSLVSKATIVALAGVLGGGAADYTSTDAFVTRRDRALGIRSLDDSRLRVLSIGVPIVGYDYANVPPAEGPAVRHIVENVTLVVIDCA